MKIYIKDVNIETVSKGKSQYQKAVVSYTYNGENRTQNIMSFANPTVFKEVQGLVGKEVEVSLTKNAQGYNEWSSIKSADSVTGLPVTRVSGSNYETPEERARRQVYIIKQSSLSTAVEILKASDAEVSVDSVIELADKLTDWVLGSSLEGE